MEESNTGWKGRVVSKVTAVSEVYFCLICLLLPRPGYFGKIALPCLALLYGAGIVLPSTVASSGSEPIPVLSLGLLKPLVSFWQTLREYSNPPVIVDLELRNIFHVLLPHAGFTSGL